MSRGGCLVVSLILSGGFLFPSALHAEPASPARPQASEQQTNKESTKNQKEDKKDIKQLYNELSTPYKKWLDEDVVYIITPEERQAFLHLQTNEEREQFIEQFWQRRNPDPDSVDNTVKEEHYRRIAYANEHFSSGVAGWRTDRGRIYIMWGPPDSIETHTQGDMYNRPMSEGGGTTQTYAYEDWTYHYLPGIGENITLEFVDPTGTGEFHLTTDPSEKDALLYVPGAGLTLMEQMGMASKANRFVRGDGTHLAAPADGGQEPANLDEFNRLDLEAKIWQPPPVKFKDLEEIVTSRIVRDQIKFSYRFDFLRITSDTVLVPLTLQIPNREMGFKETNGVQVAHLNLFGRVSTLTGRVVQTFEDTIRRDIPDSLLQQSLRSASIYQKALPLRPGLYRLDVVIKDTTNDNVGVVNTRLAVPPFPDDQLEASSLILADEMTPVAAKDIGVGQFVIGETKVRPKLDQSFPSDQPMGIFLQFYNLKVDKNTHKNRASVNLQVFKGDQPVAHVVKTSAQLQQSGQELTLQQVLSLKSFAPGKYRLQVQATDEVGNQTISRSTDFTVTPPVSPQNTAAQAHSGR
jgi:GWxTD domain-containing protein